MINITSTINFINTNSSFFNVIIALFIAILTFFYVKYTRKILNQQKKEETIKYKPYLNIKSTEVISLDPPCFQSFNIKLYCENNGNTPAKNVNFSYSLLTKKKKIKNSIIINPHETRCLLINMISINKKTISDEKIFLTINLNFEDYNGKKYLIIYEYRISEDSKSIIKLTIRKQYEKNKT